VAYGLKLATVDDRHEVATPADQLNVQRRHSADRIRGARPAGDGETMRATPGAKVEVGAIR
jgi:hypothetical protein